MDFNGEATEGAMMTSDEERNASSELRRAVDIGIDAAVHGFDWARPLDATDKVAEEITELQEAIAAGAPAEIFEELGDLFFAVANVARMLGIDPDEALARATDKFEARFAYLLALVSEDGLKPEELSLDELEDYWERAKRRPQA